MDIPTEVHLRIRSDIFPTMVYSETHYKMSDFWSRWESQYVNEECSQFNPVMMCGTGILDMKGHEIYEYDIVKVTHPEDRTGDFTNSKGYVFYDKKEGAWYHTNNKGRPPKRMFEYARIIGNIYDNPELI